MVLSIKLKGDDLMITLIGIIIAVIAIILFLKITKIALKLIFSILFIVGLVLSIAGNQIVAIILTLL